MTRKKAKPRIITTIPDSITTMEELVEWKNKQTRPISQLILAAKIDQIVGK